MEIHSLTRAIRAETDPEDRAAILEMAWMVVMSDGEVHEYEAQLMRRLAGFSMSMTSSPDVPQNAPGLGSKLRPDRTCGPTAFAIEPCGLDIRGTGAMTTSSTTIVSTANIPTV